MQNKKQPSFKNFKSGIVLSAILLLLSAASFAQSDKFTQSMQANLAKLDSAKSTEELQNLAGTFTRIGDAEKTQWLPYYYAGLALTRIGWMDPKTDKDKNAAQVKAMCDKAAAIQDNAEISTLRNIAATQQMLVNPQERWQTYGQEAAAALQKGMQADANNPRLYYLQGMNIFKTPEQFGGGKDKAKPIFEKAVALYKAEQVKPLYPHWGKAEAEEMLAQCK